MSKVYDYHSAIESFSIPGDIAISVFEPEDGVEISFKTDLFDLVQKYKFTEKVEGDKRLVIERYQHGKLTSRNQKTWESFPESVSLFLEDHNAWKGYAWYKNFEELPKDFKERFTFSGNRASADRCRGTYYCKGGKAQDWGQWFELVETSDGKVLFVANGCTWMVIDSIEPFTLVPGWILYGHNLSNARNSSPILVTPVDIGAESVRTPYGWLSKEDAEGLNLTAARA